MEYVLASFRSRNDTVGFYNFLKRNGLRCEIANTPKEAGVGCGISVKFRAEYLRAVKSALQVYGTRSFAGFFIVRPFGNKKMVKPVR